MQKTTKEKEIKKRIEKEEDFINCPRSGNSLKKLIQGNPDGISNERIAKVLMMTEEEVEEAYQNAIKKIRESLTSGL